MFGVIGVKYPIVGSVPNIAGGQEGVGAEAPQIEEPDGVDGTRHTGHSRPADVGVAAAELGRL